MNRFLSVCAVFTAMTSLVNAASRTAASASLSDVSAAVSSSARGDTVIVPAGSSTWSSSLTLTKGINLIGAGIDSTTLSRSGILILIQPDSTAIANDEAIRVEGFTFDGGNSALNLVKVYGAGASASKPFRNLVIGKNKFKNSGTVTSGSGAVLTEGQVRGVIYNNIFDRVNVLAKIMGNNTPTEWENGSFPLAFGVSDNLFFENNTIQYSSSFNGADPGWIEVGQGGRFCVRYNTWNMANANQNELWDIHGFQYNPGGQTGTMIVEFYGNSASNCTGYRWIHHRGGWGLFFNNIVSGSGGMDIGVSAYSGGCTADVLGALGNYKTEVNNTYFFNNTKNGTSADAKESQDNCGIAVNVNFWNYTSSFNGITGIGRGPSVPTGIATPGVGYWVCSTSAPTTDPAIVQSGHLYKATATGAWADYYTPYTYPHPLRSGGSGTSTNPVIAITPASLDFGVVGIGSTNGLVLTVRNAGAGTLAGTASVALPFSIVGNASYSLGSNATQAIALRYVPTQVGIDSRTVTFTGGGGASATVNGSVLGLSGLTFDSTSGSITAPFTINAPNSISQSAETLDPTIAGRAVYQFGVTTAGDYIVSMDVNAPSDGANSIFVNIDADPTSPVMIWDIPIASGVTNQTVTWRDSGGVAPQVWSLSAGTHQLIVLGREAGVVIGRIAIVASGPKPQPPTALRIAGTAN
jgi:hypothetical protein